MAKTVKKKAKKKIASQEPDRSIVPLKPDIVTEGCSIAKQSKSRLANFGDKLTQWKPGQSGNPAGAPRTKLNLWRYIGEYMAMPLDDLKAIDKTGLSMSHRAALVTAIKTAEGSWARIKEFIDRDEGKTINRTEISGKDGDAIKFYKDSDLDKM